jgi:hypothetical protein
MTLMGWLRRRRTHLRSFLLLVAVIAVELASLRNGSEIWGGVTFLATASLLLLALVGVICGRPASRVWWLGFALFGWGYFCLTFGFRDDDRWLDALPTARGLNAIQERLGWPMALRQARPATSANPFVQSGNCLVTLIIGTLGGLASFWLFGASSGIALAPEATESGSAWSTSHELRKRDRWPKLLWRSHALGTIFVALMALGTARTHGQAWAAAAFMVTCGLLTIALLGAVLEAHRARAAWVGAAMFGWGYCLLAFGGGVAQQGLGYVIGNDRPQLATSRVFEWFRANYPPVRRGVPARSDDIVANARVVETLGRCIPLQFAPVTPLRDILKHVTISTRTEEYPSGLQFYADPNGLTKAEVGLDSETPVEINLTDIPLKTSVSLLLRGFGLDYFVRDGVVIITSEDEVLSIAAISEPFSRVAHCVIALLAALVGAAIGPLVDG